MMIETGLHDRFGLSRRRSLVDHSCTDYNLGLEGGVHIG
ncbi:hypothetical protein RRG08_018775, partial [Elysia crispata]